MQNNTFFGHYQPLPIIVLEKTDSTNDYSKLLLSNFKPQVNLTAIMAKEQATGRGQRGTKWQSQAGINLTASFILCPETLTTDRQFFLTIISSLAAYDIIDRLHPQETHIKWPNDIMVGRRKISGILIENKIAGRNIKSSIIGIGINVYQSDFHLDIAYKTTSIALENPEINVTILELTRQLADRILHYSSILNHGDASSLLHLYNSRLFLRNTSANFLTNGQLIIGTIIGVEDDGLLKIADEKGITKYDLKDIVYQL